MIETTSLLNKEALLKHPDFRQWEKQSILSLEKAVPTAIKHLLTHQHLYVQFWHLKLANNSLESIDYKTLKELPVPVVIQHFIEKYYVD